MEKFENIKKIIWVSLQLIVAISLGAIIYGFIAHRHFTVRYMFPANFLVGAIVIMIGLVVFIVPVRPKAGELIDHSNYAEVMMERREHKRKKAYDIMYLGMFIILIPAILQFLLSLVL